MVFDFSQMRELFSDELGLLANQGLIDDNLFLELFRSNNEFDRWSRWMPMQVLASFFITDTTTYSESSYLTACPRMSDAIVDDHSRSFDRRTE